MENILPATERAKRRQSFDPNSYSADVLEKLRMKLEYIVTSLDPLDPIERDSLDSAMFELGEKSGKDVEIILERSRSLIMWITRVFEEAK